MGYNCIHLSYEGIDAMALPPGLDRPCRGSACQGFSLVELLVIVVIFGLLACLAQPSLEAARQQSMHSTCLGRLAAIGEATAVYSAEDPNGMALPVHPLWWSSDSSIIGAYEWGGKSGIGAPGWVEGPGGDFAYLTSKFGTLAGFGPATRPLNAILYPHGFKDSATPLFDRIGATNDTKIHLDAYRCPADNGPPLAAHCPDWVANPQRSSFDHFGTSYNANLFMTSYAGGGPVNSNSPYLRPVSRVPAPARTLAYDENIGRWAWACKRENWACTQAVGLEGIDPGPTKAVRGWHGKNWTFNRAFVDAHAESQKVFIEGTSDAEGYSEHYRNELVFPDDPNTQARSVCIIIRGEGWQMDTLPDPQIRTGLLWDGSDRVS
ncbi:MAG: prepilin-type N-terminal cleavage/methylation domain-containing protein, partial [Planctomycetes bacterium]|nr:prepilin-type N-terminal cleavage/methylation domain-containing protein [Planctomycetota bacterium]